MDLSKFDSLQNSEAQLSVMDPNNEPLTWQGDEGPQPVKISLVCCDSAEYSNIHKRQVTDIADRASSRKGKIITGESAEKDKLDLLVACTKGWAGFTMNGAPFPYSPANARTLYTRYKFIREQVDEFIHERGNFLANASIN